MATDSTLQPNGSKGPLAFEPYRATKLWNALVTEFREELPVGRHRRHMKSYESCFVASEAVSWLLQRLQENPNFGEHVTRAQTVQLLHKFQKANLVVDVRGSKHEKLEFVDNGRLYRFTDAAANKTPAPSKKPTRTPLGLRTSLMNSDSALAKKSTEKLKPEMERGHSIACITQEVANMAAPKTDALHRKTRRVLPKRSQSCREERTGEDHPAKVVQLSEEEVNGVWKDQILDGLQTILQLKDIEDVLDPEVVNVQHLIHNMTLINKNGLVTNIDKKDQLPNWIISAMRCLAYWPTKVESNIPDYPGFENDVYNVIKDYFHSMKSAPLIPHQLYEVFLSVMVYVDNIGKQSHQQAQYGANVKSPTIPSTTSVENLLMNMTKDNAGPDDVLIHNDPDVTILVGGMSPPMDTTRTLPRCRSASGIQTRMETSFGVHTDEPLTRLYRQGGDVGGGVEDCGYYSNQEVEFHFGLEQLGDHVVPKSSQHRPYSVCSPEELLNRNHLHTPSDYLTSQRHGSMNNVHEVPNGMDSGLKGRINSWSSVQSGLHAKSDAQHLENLSNQYRTRQHSAKPPVDRLRPPPYPTYLPPYTQNPPPYIPPPSYDSVRSRPPPHPLGIQRKISRSQLPNGRTRGNSFSSAVDFDMCSLDVSQSMPLMPQNPCDLAHSSYRQAIDGFNPSSTPVGRSLFGGSQSTMKRSVSSSSVLTPLSRDRVYDALQMCCLLIPPANRRKLHLLLRFMNKLTANTQLVLHGQREKKDMALEAFTRCIMHSEDDEVDHNDMLTHQIVTFMVEGYVEIMKVPEGLKEKVDDKVSTLRRAKISNAWDSEDDDDHIESPFVPYCQQVSAVEFERQKMSGSQQALHNLLDDIVRNKTMSLRDKKRHLKQFQKNYPTIYSKKFPNNESEAAALQASVKSKAKTPRLANPLQKLRNLRL